MTVVSNDNIQELTKAVNKATLVQMADILTRDYASYREIRFIEALRFLSHGEMMSFTDTEVMAFFDLLEKAGKKGQLLDGISYNKSEKNEERLTQLEQQLGDLNNSITSILYAQSAHPLY